MELALFAALPLLVLREQQFQEDAVKHQVIASSDLVAKNKFRGTRALTDA